MRPKLLIFCLLAYSLNAQTGQTAATDSLFRAWDSLETPGAALGVIRDGQLVYAKGYGSADLEHDLPITPASVFYIGSVSKQFVTFCLLLLEEQGLLGLDDPIRKYLPDFPVYQAPLTIRHFIHHTSGVRDYLTLMDLRGRSYLDHITEQEVYGLIKKQKELNFTPGEKYLYSNSCYFMLAMIVEKASGKTLREFARENIFDPLGMEHTLFYDDNRDLIKNRVFSYEKTEEGFDNLINRFDLVGSGGVYSSVEDILLWDQNFYHNKLGKGGQALIEKMQADGKLNNGESAGYAFALNVGTYRGLKTVSHGGALAGYRAELMRFPEQHFSVVILANRDDANPTRKAYQIADIYLKDQLGDSPDNPGPGDHLPAPGTLPPGFGPGQLTGAYELEPGARVEVGLRNDNLLVTQNWNKAAYTLAHHSGDAYRIPGNTGISFTFSDLKDGAAQQLTILQNGNKTVCKRVYPAAPPAGGDESIAGDYYGEEIDATYHIYPEAGSLVLQIEDTEPRKLEFYDADQWLSDGLLFRFMRENGQITGFELDAGRVRNLKFVKL